MRKNEILNRRIFQKKSKIRQRNMEDKQKKYQRKSQKNIKDMPEKYQRCRWVLKFNGLIEDFLKSWGLLAISTLSPPSSKSLSSSSKSTSKSSSTSKSPSMSKSKSSSTSSPSVEYIGLINPSWVSEVLLAKSTFWNVHSVIISRSSHYSRFVQSPPVFVTYFLV